MSIDLHTHTTASDGLLTPQELVRAAHAAGVRMLAITDHDVVDAYAGLAAPSGLTLVTGIEFSTAHARQGIHVVGLNVALDSDAMRTALAAQRDARAERAGRIAERLRKRGIAGALSGAARHAGGALLGRPHFASWLVEIGACTDREQAFRKYLGRGGGVIDTWPPLEAVIGWIRDAGGDAVLAHPAKYGLTRLRLDKLAGAFAAAGGLAMEVISGMQRPELTHALALLAARHGLAASAGSDFHQPQQPWAQLGRVAALPPGCAPVWDRW
jgi:predicted metal-dependent phosphoesterase TrpH